MALGPSIARLPLLAQLLPRLPQRSFSVSEGRRHRPPECVRHGTFPTCRKTRRSCHVRTRRFGAPVVHRRTAIRGNCMPIVACRTCSWRSVARAGAPGLGGCRAELRGADALAGRWNHGWRVRIRLAGNPIRQGGPGSRAGPPTGAGRLRVKARWRGQRNARAPASLRGTRRAGDDRNPEPGRDAAHDHEHTYGDNAQPASHANDRRSVRVQRQRGGPSGLTV
jgi:hypothetical protein